MPSMGPLVLARLTFNSYRCTLRPTISFWAQLNKSGLAGTISLWSKTNTGEASSGSAAETAAGSAVVPQQSLM